MATKVAARFVNKVSWEEDRASLQRVLKSAKSVKKELESIKKLQDQIGRGGRAQAPQAPRAPSSRPPRTTPSKAFEQRKAERISTFLESSALLRGQSAARKESLREMLMQKKTMHDLRMGMIKIQNEERERVELNRKITREMKKQNAASRRLNSSFTQLATTAFSVFTAVEGIGAIINTGMSFERIQTTFLAVSKNSEEAADNFNFVRGEAKRLGLDLQETAKGFSQLLAAAGDKLDKGDLREILTSVSEASTVLGLTVDDQAGALRAINQMVSKGQVMSEELKGQLGERLPFAIRAMAAAVQEAGLSTNGTTEELFKLMENGQVMAKDVLPHFAKQLRILANDNDAVANAIRKNLNVQVGRARTGLQEFANTIFKGGVKDAIMFLLKGFNDLMDEGEGLGRLIGGFLKGAMLGIVAPVRLVVAVFLDLKNILMDTGIVSEETFDLIAKYGSQLAGAAASIWLMVKLFTKLRAAMLGVSAAKAGLGLGDVAGAATKGGGKGIFGKLKGLAGRGNLPMLALSAAAAGTMATQGAGSTANIAERLRQSGTTSGANPFLGGQFQSRAQSFDPSTPRVVIEITPDGEGFSHAINARIKDSNQELQNKFYQEIYGQ